MSATFLDTLEASAKAAPNGPYHLSRGEDGEYFAIAGGDESRSKSKCMARFDCLPFRAHAPQEQRDALAKMWEAMTPERILALVRVARSAKAFLAANPKLNGTGPLRGDMEALSALPQ